ncbi:MAG: FkbM family methyltransferase [Candidatus Competibacter sp.]|nr:FkbM family methyltransferase [Candidatus Competibacter sp.]
MNLTKRVALSAISCGLKLPGIPIDRYQELTYLKQLIKSLDINCVFDVGANKGQFATELRQIGYRGLICSFEPLSLEFSYLSHAFRNDPYWQGYQIALGHENGKTVINVIPNLTVMSSLLQSKVRWQGMKAEEIEIRRLDDFFTDFINNISIQNLRIFLKMDTQGYDMNVFEGGRGCLHFVQGLQSELSIVPLYYGMPHYIQALETYEQAGFKLYNLSVVSRTGEGDLQELNCMMRR